MKTKGIKILFLLMVLSFPLSVCATEKSIGQDGAFFFPSSLVIIEDETFAGTSPQTLFLPYGVKYIGKKAFINIQSLTKAYIPETTKYIDDSSFTFTPQLTIHCIDGSYAKEWAYKHNIPFVIDDIWNIDILSVGSNSARTASGNGYHVNSIPSFYAVICRSCSFEDRSRRPQDRPELYPIDYRFP